MTVSGPLAFDGNTSQNPCPDGSGYHAVCDCCLSVAVDPGNVDHILAGGIQLYESTDGGSRACHKGLGIIHPDQNDLTFDPKNSNVLFVGNDGGIWAHEV
jgi:hypothetical protein